MTFIIERNLLDFEIFKEISEIVDSETISATQKLKDCKHIDEQQECLIKHIILLVKSIKDHVQNTLGTEIDWESESESAIIGHLMYEQQATNNVGTQIIEHLNNIRLKFRQANYRILNQAQAELQYLYHPAKNIIKEMEKLHMSLFKFEQKKSLLDQSHNDSMYEEWHQQIESRVNQLLYNDTASALSVGDRYENSSIQTNEYLHQTQQQDIIALINELRNHCTENDCVRQNMAHLEIVRDHSNQQQAIPVQQQKIYTMRRDIQESYSYNDKGLAHCVIMKCMNGNYAIGGGYKQLILLDSQLELIRQIDIPDIVARGISYGSYLYCYLKSSTLSVFDQNTFSIIKDISIQSGVNKLSMVIDDYMLVGQWDGYIDLIQLSTHESVFQNQLTNHSDIYDIACMKNNNTFAFATNNGLQMGRFQFNNNNISFVERQYIFLQDKWILCVEAITENLLLAGISGMDRLCLIDLEKKEEIALDECGQYDGWYNVIQRVKGFNYETFPFVLVKDKSKVVIVNVKTFTVHSFIDCQYENYSLKYSLLQNQTKDQLQFLTFAYNSKERSVKKYVIGKIE